MNEDYRYEFINCHSEEDAEQDPQDSSVGEKQVVKTTLVDGRPLDKIIYTYGYKDQIWQLIKIDQY